MSEQLALEQSFRERRAVDGHERLFPAGRILVDEGGQEFLPGAALARDQDRGAGGRDVLRPGQDLLHSRVLRHELTPAGPAVPAARHRVRPVSFHGAADNRGEHLPGERLQHVVARPFPHRLHGVFDRPVRRHHEDGQGRGLPPDLAEKLQAVHPGHFHVRNEQGERPLVDFLEGVRARGDRLDVVPVAGQDFRQGGPHLEFVVHDEDRIHRFASERRGGRLPAGGTDVSPWAGGG